jgi:hypothetical protein
MTDWAEQVAFWQRWHSYVLGCKGIDSEEELRAAIDHDLVVAASAAGTLLSGLTSRSSVNELFADQYTIRDEVLAVTDEAKVNHLGFLIHEPLDIWLEGLSLWAPRSECEVVGVKRFTASDGFRERVGSFVEMAQVWLRRDGAVIELELFDIHRTNPTIPTVDGISLGDGIRRTVSAVSPAVLRPALDGDDIWHFGVRIEHESAVEHLHERFLALVERDHRFRLRTPQTVANPWHGSVHTKLANLEADVEVEFLTYRVDWQRRQS